MASDAQLFFAEALHVVVVISHEARSEDSQCFLFSFLFVGSLLPTQMSEVLVTLAVSTPLRCVARLGIVADHSASYALPVHSSGAERWEVAALVAELACFTMHVLGLVARVPVSTLTFRQAL